MFKKYIKRGGKLHGPYLYENVRVNGKVVTKYLGKADGKKVGQQKKVVSPWMIFAIVLIGLVLISSVYTGITGRDITEVLEDEAEPEEVEEVVEAEQIEDFDGDEDEPVEEPEPESAEPEEVEEPSEESGEESDSGDIVDVVEEPSEEPVEEEVEESNESEESEPVEEPEIEINESEVEEPEIVENETEVEEPEEEVEEDPEEEVEELEEVEEPKIEENESEIEIPIIIEENETEIVVNDSEDVNITVEVNESVIESNITIPENATIPELNVTSNTTLFEGNMTEANASVVIQERRTRIVINQPVRWVKTISIDNISRLDDLELEIPLEAENISIKLGDEEVQEVLEEIREFEEIIEEADREDILNSSVTGLVSASSGESKGLVYRLRDFLSGLFGGKTFTGRTIQELGLEEKISEVNGSKVVNLTEVVEESGEGELAVEYYTEGPVAVEDVLAKGKRLSVSASDELGYTDVLAFVDFPELVEVGSVERIRIQWLEEGRLLPPSVNDTDGNGFIDYVEWEIPHLSNQTFEIIVVNAAEHLDENRLFVEDAYEFVKERENITINIPDTHYLRVEFAKNLTPSDDITIFAESVDGASVEVYEKDGDEKIADFGVIGQNDLYQILLGDLVGEQKVFDLRVVGGSVDFDYVVDPDISTCQTIGSPGVYTLTTSIPDADGTCFTISSGNVTLDGQGFTITGDSTGFGVSITTTAPNITVMDLSTSSYNAGIASSVDIQEVNISGNTLASAALSDNGIQFTGSSNNVTIEGNTITMSAVTGTVDAITITGSNFTVVDNVISTIIGDGIDGATSFSLYEGNTIDVGSGGAAFNIFSGTNTNNDYLFNRINVTSGSTLINIQGGSNLTFIGNNISGNGSTVMVDIGVGVDGDINLTDNRLEYSGAGTSGGGALTAGAIRVSFGRSHIGGNIIESHPTTFTQKGMYISSDNNQIYNNVINATGGDQSHGLRFEGASHNVMYGNTIWTSGTSDSDGIELGGQSDNNTFTDDNIQAVADTEFTIDDGSDANITHALLAQGPNISIQISGGNVISLKGNISGPGPEPAGLRNISDYLIISGTGDIAGFNMSYTDLDELLVTESSLRIYNYSTGATEWNEVESGSIDTTTNEVSGFVNYTGTFALLGDNSNSSGFTDCQAITLPGEYQLLNNVTSTNSCIEISASNVTFNCNGNRIIYGTTTGNHRYGIEVNDGNTSTLDNVTVQNCVVMKALRDGTDGYGIKFTNVTNGLIFNNSVFTNGTQRNYAVFVERTAQNVSVRDNQLHTNGTSTINPGVVIEDSPNNNVTGNNISTQGTSTSHGIITNGPVNNSLLHNNIILTHGTGTDEGIYAQDPANFTISYNNITTQGGTGASGIRMDISASGTFRPVHIIYNKINATGRGIYYSETPIHDINISYNNIVQSGQEGIWVEITGNLTIYGNVVHRSTNNGDSAILADSGNTLTDFLIQANHLNSSGHTINIASANTNGGNITGNIINVSVSSGGSGVTITGTNTQNHWIYNNTITQAGGFTSNGGFNIASSNTSLISNNVTGLGTTSGVGITFTDSRGDNNIARDNDILVSNEGIRLGGNFAAHYNITDNRIRTFGGGSHNGITSLTDNRDFLISNNTINTTQATSHCINLGGNNLREFLVIDNNLECSGDGILTTTSTVRNNTILRNVIVTTSVNGRGIESLGANNTFEYNNITTTQAGGEGIRVTFRQDRFRYNDVVTLSTAAYGIEIAGSIAAEFVGNRINATQSTALRFSSNGDYNNFTGDQFFGEGTEFEIDFVGTTQQGNTFDNVILDGDINFTAHEIANVQIDVERSPPAGDPSGRINISKYIEITGISSTGDLDFNISYTDAEVASVDEATLAIYNFSTGLGDWFDIGSSSVDVTNNVVSSGNLSSAISGTHDMGIFAASSGLSACGEILTPGEYTLDQSVSSEGTCLNVTVDNVALDCGGNTILFGAGNASVPKYGIWVASGKNITISNCTIINTRSENNGGIAFLPDLLYNSDLLVENVTLSQNNITLLGSGANEGTSDTNGIEFLPEASSSFELRDVDLTYNYVSVDGNNSVTTRSVMIVPGDSGNTSLINGTDILIDNNNFVMNNSGGTTPIGLQISFANMDTINVTDNNLTFSANNTGGTGITLGAQSDLVNNTNILISDNNFSIRSDDSPGSSILLFGGGFEGGNIVRGFNLSNNYLEGGISVLDSSEGVIESNFITSTAPSILFGINLITTSGEYINITGNNLSAFFPSTGGSTGIFVGRVLDGFQSHNLTIVENQIALVASGSGSGGDGIEFFRNVSDTLVANNTISTSGSSGNNDALVFSSSGNFPGYMQRNIFVNNTLLDIAGLDLNIGISILFNGTFNGTTLIDQEIRNYSISGTLNDSSVLSEGDYFVVKESGFGEVIFRKPINGSGGNFSSDVNIGNNSIFGNGSLFNVPANLTLFEIGDRGFSNPVVLRDDTLCSDCENFTSLVAQDVNFNVSGFSEFEIGDGTGFIDACGTLSSSNVSYTVTEDLSALGTCLNVPTDNVTINCAGRPILYGTDGLDNVYGINISKGGGEQIENVTIENCFIYKNTTSGAGAHAIRVFNLTTSIFDNNMILANGSTDNRGISLNFSVAANLTDNNITTYGASSDAIVVSSSIDNVFTSNKVNATIATSNEFRIDYSGPPQPVNNSVRDLLFTGGEGAPLNDVDFIAFNGSSIKDLSPSEKSSDPVNQTTIGGRAYNITNTTTGSWLFLNASYSGASLPTDHHGEATIRIWRFNGSEWQKTGFFDSNYYDVDTTNDRAFANITSFSEFAVMIDMDVFAPNITLFDPINNTINDTTTEITFIYNVTDFTGISSCTLIVNGTDYLSQSNNLTQFDDTIANGAAGNNFVQLISSGLYDWGISCNDTTQFNNIALSEIRNLSVNVDDIGPNISDVDFSPNGTSASTFLQFNFTVQEVKNSTSTQVVDSCSLYVDGVEEVVNDTIDVVGPIDVVLEFDLEVNGNFSVFASCLDNATIPNQANTSVFFSNVSNICDRGDPFRTCIIDTDRANFTNGLNVTDGLDFPIAELIINNSATLSLGGNGSRSSLNLSVANLTIEAGSCINASARGFLGGKGTRVNGSGPGFGGTTTSSNVRGGGAGGHGGPGGNGDDGDVAFGFGGGEYDDLIFPTQFGSGGASAANIAGGSGGGSIFIEASQFVRIDGCLSADGNPGIDGGVGGGGGAGGTIFINATEVLGNGSVSARGGKGGDETGAGGGNEENGGGAGGGIIAVHYEDLAVNFSGFDSRGGERGEGGGGTNTAVNGSDGSTILIDRVSKEAFMVSSYRFRNTTETNFTNLTILNANVRILGNATLNVTENLNFTGSSLTRDNVTEFFVGFEVEDSFGSVTFDNSNVTGLSLFNLTFLEFELDSGSLINMSGGGFLGGLGTNANGTGPGKGGGNNPGSNTIGGGGAGHGGPGGNGDDGVENGYGFAGAEYDSLVYPTQPGSGGGAAANLDGGNGGGAVILNINNTASINGSITVDGLSAATSTIGAGGGAGGSVFINATSVYGIGAISASGGIGGNDTNGEDSGGGAGGGIISIRYDNLDLNLSKIDVGKGLNGTAASGAPTSQSGQAGAAMLFDRQNDNAIIVSGYRYRDTSVSTHPNLTVLNAEVGVVNGTLVDVSQNFNMTNATVELFADLRLNTNATEIINSNFTYNQSFRLVINTTNFSDAGTVYDGLQLSREVDGSGSIDWISNLSVLHNLSTINISGNIAFVNSTLIPGLNQSANITLFNVDRTDPIARVDFDDDGTFADCSSSICTNSSYDAVNDIFKYNVTQFTTYSEAEGGIVGCFNITEAGLYTLPLDISAGGNCIEINASDVRLDCAGFAITHGTNTGASYGIRVDEEGDEVNNVTIENCVIRKALSSSIGTGIVFTGGPGNVTVYNNTILGNGSGTEAVQVNSEGLEGINNISSNILDTTSTSSSDSGVQVDGASNLTIGYNIITSNAGGTSDAGVRIGAGTQNATVVGNSIDVSAGIGILIDNSATIENNNFSYNNITAGDESGVYVGTNVGDGIKFYYNNVTTTSNSDEAFELNQHSDGVYLGNVVNTKGTNSEGFATASTAGFRNVITQNIINASFTGINIGGSSSSFSNLTYNNITTSANGIVVSDFSLIFENNITYAGTQGGTGIIAGDDSNVTNNRVIGTANSYVGTLFSDDRISIIGNVINVDGSGLRFQSGSNFNTIVDNFVNSSQLDIVFFGSGHSGNNFTNNILDGVINFTSHSIDGVSFAVNGSLFGDDAGIQNISKYMTIKNTSASGAFIDFNITYNDSDASGVPDESTIRLYHYNTTSGAWEVVISSSVDTANNVVSSGNVSSFSEFGAFGNSSETINPNVTSLTEAPSDPATYSAGQVYEFNATVVDDTAVGTVLIEFDETNFTVFNVSDVYNFTISDLAAGVYSYYWRANDTSNNLNITAVFTYTVNNASSEVNLTLNGTESNVTIEFGDSILLNGTLVSGDAGGTLELYNNGTLINVGSGEVSNLTAFNTLGEHNITVIYVGSQNFTGSSETYFVTVSDTTNPSVIDVFAFPSDINQTQSTNITANVTNGVEVETVLASVTLPNGTILNFTMNNASADGIYNFTYVTGASDPIRQYNVTIIANDTIGLINNSEVTAFNVSDITNPDVFDLRPVADTGFNTTETVEIAANVTDNIAVGSVTANLTLPNGTVNVLTLSNVVLDKYNVSFTIPAILTGLYNITFVAIDTSGNINSTSQTNFTAAISDSTDPIISFVDPTPANATNLSQDFILVNVTATDNIAISTINVSLYNSSSDLIASGEAGSSPLFVNFSSLSDGTYFINASATDTSSNVAGTETRTIVLDTVAPVVTLINPGSGVEFNNSQSITFQYNVTESGTGVSHCNFTVDSSVVDSNFTVDTSAGAVNEFINTFSAGAHSWNVSCFDNAANEGISETRNFTVEAAPDVAEEAPTPSGGGGGSARLRAPVIIEPESLSVDMFANTEVERAFTIINTDVEAIAVDIGIEGVEIDGVVTPLEENIILRAKEERTVMIKVKAGEKGLLTGTIIFKQRGERLEVPIVINVKSKDFLFDTAITVSDEFRVIDEGEKLKAQVDLIQVGTKEKVDVVVTYVVKDFKGQIMLQESETFFVLGAKNFIKEFNTERLGEGKYIVGMEVVYPGAFATSSAQFEVQGVFGQFTQIIIVAIVAAGLIAAGASWYVRKGKKTKRKKK